MSLSVKDIKTSKEFYQNLGFEVLHGDETQGWLILKNGETNIGLFQGMFEKNTLTFNPGWNTEGKDTREFTDVRELQAQLKAKGITIEKEVETDSGPGHFSLLDPDGNPILIDQHREK